MSLVFRFTNDGVDWGDLERLFKAADLGGRAITDGEYHATIYDVVVHPDYQGQGMGIKIFQDNPAAEPWGVK